MTASARPVRIEVVLPAEPPGDVFDRWGSELRAIRHDAGVRFDLGPAGSVFAADATGTERPIARVVAWEPGRRIALAWQPSDWEPALPPVTVEYRFEPAGDGTRVIIESVDWADLAPFREAGQLAGWVAGELAAGLARSMSPARLADWWTDRAARRPSGASARANYADPLFHRPNFVLLLDRMRLTAADTILEVGCGGGAFLKDALASGCRAFAIDHSVDMVDLARRQNRAAIDEGRAEIRLGDAGALPFPDAVASWAVTTGAIGFFPDPVRALAEMRRVVRPGGRLIVFSGTKELRGTPAAPEPIAARVHFFEDDELAAAAARAGWADARVDRPEMGPYARAARLPPEVIAFFEQEGPSSAQVLEARRPAA